MNFGGVSGASATAPKQDVFNSLMRPADLICTSIWPAWALFSDGLERIQIFMRNRLSRLKSNPFLYAFLFKSYFLSLSLIISCAILTLQTTYLH